MSSHNRYVLMADDDKDDIALMEEAFERKKINEKLVAVRNGNDLLHYLSSITDTASWPQLILLDLNMPDKNGKETLMAIKQNLSLKSIPVVIFSTSGEDSQIKECYALGANSYIVKPAGFEKLLSTVETIHSYWCKTVSVAF